MINLILKLAMFVGASLCYIHGETSDGWAKILGKSNKNWKLAVGIPIGLGSLLLGYSFFSVLLTIGAYAIAGSMPYGATHWWTKLVGQKNAIAICGGLMGLSSVPILGFWAIPLAIISAWAWYGLSLLDDKGLIKEPQIALYRSITAFFGVLGA